MEFICECCYYKASSKQNLEKHLNTNLHKKACIASTEYVCDDCGKLFKSRQSLHFHKKSCKYKKDSQVENTNDKNEIKQLKKQLGDLIETNKNSSIATKESAQASNKSMSMMKYAMINFKDAPPLLELTDKETCELLEYEGATDTQTEREANEIFARTLIHKHKDKILDKYFGKMTVGHLKTQDPRTRKIWTVDTSRQTFIIMEPVNKKGDNEWKSDKSGKRLASLVIEPTLRKSGQMLGEFVINQQDLTNPESSHFIQNLSDGKRQQIMDETYHAIIIQKQIKNEIYEKKILQYIAPYFNFNYFKNADDGKLQMKEFLLETESENYKVVKKVVKVEILESKYESDSDSSYENSIVYKYGPAGPKPDPRLKKKIKSESSDSSCDSPIIVPKKVIKKKAK